MLALVQHMVTGLSHVSSMPLAQSLPLWLSYVNVTEACLSAPATPVKLRPHMSGAQNQPWAA